MVAAVFWGPNVIGETELRNGLRNAHTHPVAYPMAYAAAAGSLLGDVYSIAVEFGDSAARIRHRQGIYSALTASQIDGPIGSISHLGWPSWTISQTYGTPCRDPDRRDAGTIAQVRSARYLMSNTKLDGALNLATIAQSALKTPARGEGLAQVFDVDAF